MDSKFKNSIEYLTKVFPSVLSYTTQGECVIITTPKTLPKLVTFLKKHTATKYEQLIDLSAIDHPQRKYRFEIVYQFLSVHYNQRLSVAVFTSEAMSMESITPIYSAAGWYEREVWDRFGIYFTNHPDLRRMLTDYGFRGHPLRKDFPVTGFLERRYSEMHKRAIYEKVNLAQEYRIFTLDNTWNLKN